MASLTLAPTPADGPLVAYSANVLAAAKWIGDAEAILVCAGAGLSAKDEAAGEAVYVSQRDFAAHYPFMLRYGYTTAYECMGLMPDRRVPEEAKWGFWSEHYYNMRRAFAPSEGYRVLRELVGDRDHFVLTSNVDGCFDRSGWDRDRVYTPQGDAAFYQCLRPCARDSIFEAEPVLSRLRAARGADGLVPSSDVPRCPRCGGPVFMNLRGGDWFLHSRYDDLNKRLLAWVDGVIRSRRRLAIVEVGAGFNTPVVTRFPMEAITREASEMASLVRLNPSDAEVPRDLPCAVGLRDGWAALQQLADILRDPPMELGIPEQEVKRQRQEQHSIGGRPVARTTEGHQFDWRQALRSLQR